jgi:hypothetical protein
MVSNKTLNTQKIQVKVKENLWQAWLILDKSILIVPFIRSNLRFDQHTTDTVCASTFRLSNFKRIVPNHAIPVRYKKMFGLPIDIRLTKCMVRYGTPKSSGIVLNSISRI